MDGIDFGTLGLGIATEQVVPVAIGGGLTAALTVAGRLAAPIGSQLHRHAPAAAGAAAAIFTGLVTKSGAGALAALLVGGLIWGSERLLEYQAQRLLPSGGR